jgi:hypothetical protein
MKGISVSQDKAVFAPAYPYVEEDEQDLFRPRVFYRPGRLADRVRWLSQTSPLG